MNSISVITVGARCGRRDGGFGSLFVYGFAVFVKRLGTEFPWSPEAISCSFAIAVVTLVRCPPLLGALVRPFWLEAHRRSRSRRDPSRQRMGNRGGEMFPIACFFRSTTARFIVELSPTKASADHAKSSPSISVNPVSSRHSCANGSSSANLARTDDASTGSPFYG
jgi:hypothetical protein